MNRLSGLMIVFCALLSACKRDDPGVITLTYATPYSQRHPFSRADQDWIAWVEHASHGRLRIRPFWGGLISSTESIIEIRHGVADIGLITPIYTRGGAQALRDQTGFYGGVRDIERQVAIYKCLAARFPILDQELYGLRVLAVQGGNLPAIMTRRRPIDKLEDLRGLRIRVPKELLGVMRALGADPVDMPMGDVYPALAKGVIDGVVAPADTLPTMHFAEVAPHFAMLYVSRGAYPARAINAARWNALPPDLRAVLAQSERPWEQALARQLTRAEQAGYALGHAQGVTFTRIPPADQARFDALYNARARITAEALSRQGIDGVALFDEAQRLVRNTAAGAVPLCSSTSVRQDHP